MRATLDVTNIETVDGPDGALVGALQAGSVVAGRYRLAVPLTHFPAAIRWLAFDEWEKARVTLHLRDGGDGVLQRLNALHQRLAAVQHPVIVAANDVGRDGDGVIFVASGLDARVSAEAMTAVDLQASLRWSLELLHGIDAAHVQGLVHGDIGCHSVLLTAGQDGQLHARLVGFVVGEVREAEGDGPTPGVSTDVRGVAEFLFKLLTGTDVGEEAARLLPKPGVTVPPALAAVIVDQLDDPDHNPSALEFARKLEPFVQAVAVSPAIHGSAALGHDAGELHEAFAMLEQVESPDELCVVLANEVLDAGGVRWVEVAAFDPEGGLVSLSADGDPSFRCGGATSVVSVGDDVGTADQVMGPLPSGVVEELRHLCRLPSRRFRRLRGTAAAALSANFCGRTVAVVVCWSESPAQLEGESPSAHSELLSSGPDLLPAELLVAHAAEVSRRFADTSVAIERGASWASIELTDDALLVMDAAGIVQHATALVTELLGCRHDDLIGRLLHEVPGLAPLVALADSAAATVEGATRTTLRHPRVLALGPEDLLTVQSAWFPGGVVVRLARVSPEGNAAPTRRATYSPWQAIVANDAATLSAKHAAEQAAMDDLPVYFVGEAGTGRRTFARAIHEASGRASGPLTVIDCGRQPGGGAPSIFGVEPGSASASSFGHATAGKVALTEGGTLVLVNVGALDDSTVDRLRRLASSGTFERDGGSVIERVDVRLMFIETSGSGEPSPRSLLADESRGDHFIELSALRDRVGALDTLLPALMERRALLAGRPALTVSPAVATGLSTHSWPGNVRELVELLDAWLSLYPSDQDVVDRTPAHIRRVNY